MAIANRKTAKKAAEPAKSKSVKIKLTPAKVSAKGKGRPAKLTISGISMDKLQSELKHQAALTTAMDRHKEMLKEKGLTIHEKSAIRRDIEKYRSAIKASKQHASALKRHI